MIMFLIKSKFSEAGGFHMGLGDFVLNYIFRVNKSEFVCVQRI